jgi:hypothetical protein
MVPRTPFGPVECLTSDLPMRAHTQQALIKSFLRLQTLVISIFCPHYGEYIWSKLGHDKSIMHERYVGQRLLAWTWASSRIISMHACFRFDVYVFHA